MQKIHILFLFLLYIFGADKISAQDLYEIEYNRYWNQVDFWEKAGNTEKIIEYKEKLVDLYRKHYPIELPLMLRNIANTYGELAQPYWEKSNNNLEEALIILSSRPKSDENYALYFNCLGDLVGFNYERKEYLQILNIIDKYSAYINNSYEEKNKEKIENVKKWKSNTILLLNDSCQRLVDYGNHDLAKFLISQYVTYYIELLNKDSINEDMSNLAINTVWIYANIIEKSGKIDESIKIRELHNNYIRKHIDFFIENGLSMNYLWVMERYLANRYYDIGDRQKDLDLSKLIVKEARLYGDSLLLSEKLVDLGVSYERDHTIQGRTEGRVYFEEALNILTKLQSALDVRNNIIRVLDFLLAEYVLCGQYRIVVDLCKTFQELLHYEADEAYEESLMNVLSWESSAYHHLNYSVPESRKKAIYNNELLLKYKKNKYGKESVDYLSQLRLNALAYEERDTFNLNRIYSEGYEIWNKMGRNKKEYASFLVSFINYKSHTNPSEPLDELLMEMEGLCANGIAEFHSKISFYYDRSIIEYNKCNYEMSLEYIEKALSVCKENLIFSEVEEKLAMVLCQKSNITYCLGLYDISKESAYTAYSVIEKLGNDNLLKSDILYSLSYLMDDFGERENALKMSIEAFKMMYKCKGEEIELSAVNSTLNKFDPISQINYIDSLNIDLFLHDPEVVVLFVTKASAYLSIGNLNKAEECLNNAEKYLDFFNNHSFYKIKEHKQMVKTLILYNRGVLSFWKKDYYKAIDYLKEYRNVLGSTTSLPWLNTLYALVKDSVNFENETKIRLDYLRNEIKNKFIYLSDHERELFMSDKISSGIAEMEFYAHLYPESGYAKKAAFEAVLLEKGLALSSSYGIQNMIELSSVDTKKLNALRKQYSLAKNEDERTNIQLEISLEEQKLQKGINISKYLDELLVDLDDVKNHIDSQSAVVEFIRFISVLDSSVYRYGALITTKDMEIPIYVDLCTEQVLNRLKLKGPTIYKEKAIDLYRLVLEPIIPFILDKEKVYFSPSGLLHQLNIEIAADYHLPNTDFLRISSSRELCRNTVIPLPPTNIVMFGGLCYDCDVHDNLYDKDNRLKFEMSPNDSIFRSGIAYLPGSLQEVKNIKNVISEKGISDKETYTGNEGTEFIYKSLSGRDVTVLHMSTHGFSLGHNTITEFNDPMRKCGLLLSGAQKAWDGRSNSKSEDGILLGEEISNVRLVNNKLIVLSACETGLGSTSSEGVWGLQRAFKKAGAGSIIMSLWKVNDYSTNLLMSEFYRHFLSGESAEESLRLALVYVREYKDEDGILIFEDPNYWAAWILLDAID